MNSKRIGVALIVLIIAVAAFYSTSLVVPEKTEAVIIPDHILELMYLKACCDIYSLTCPRDVKDACFQDCWEWGNCYLP